jgi:hypothetical protein
MYMWKITTSCVSIGISCIVVSIHISQQSDYFLVTPDLFLYGEDLPAIVVLSTFI